MDQEKITEIFDQMASSYDDKWRHTAPIANALHLLAGAALAGIPHDARILCVGAGTGSEILRLAAAYPQWRFTAVEPSSAMLDVFRRRAEEHGIVERCAFHHGFVESIPAQNPFDAATAFLVSQFILDRHARSGFFRDIAHRLRPGGSLVTADMAGDVSDADFGGLLEIWFRATSLEDFSREAAERMKQSYTHDVAVLPPAEVAKIIEAGGFAVPTRFYQAGLIHAWQARRKEAIELV